MGREAGVKKIMMVEANCVYKTELVFQIKNIWRFIFGWC